MPVAPIVSSMSSRRFFVFATSSKGSAEAVCRMVSLSSRSEALAARCVTSFAASMAAHFCCTVRRSSMVFGRKYVLTCLRRHLWRCSIPRSFRRVCTPRQRRWIMQATSRRWRKLRRASMPLTQPCSELRAQRTRGRARRMCSWKAGSSLSSSTSRSMASMKRWSMRLPLWCTMVKHSVHMSSCVCSQKMVARMLWHWLHSGVTQTLEAVCCLRCPLKWHFQKHWTQKLSRQ
mmetsp:Transcript_52166/g.153957  ORF Transcript_52166/g.153957 Transcript_52166/m.153957 type:complete len:232 (+) Transcript_52166:326-1021(+)